MVFSRRESDRIEDLVGVVTLRELSVYRAKMSDIF